MEFALVVHDLMLSEIILGFVGCGREKNRIPQRAAIEQTGLVGGPHGDRRCNPHVPVLYRRTQRDPLVMFHLPSSSPMHVRRSSQIFVIARIVVQSGNLVGIRVF